MRRIRNDATAILRSFFAEQTVNTLSKAEKNALRQKGHRLKPVVMIGQNGLSTAVLRELDLSLNHHELMKVKIAGAEREERNHLINDMCQQLGADLVQRIGNIALIYRARPDDNR